MAVISIIREKLVVHPLPKKVSKYIINFFFLHICYIICRTTTVKLLVFQHVSDCKILSCKVVFTDRMNIILCYSLGNYDVRVVR